MSRLHRHDRQRPEGFSAARTAIIAPTAAVLAGHVRDNGEPQGRVPLGLGRVYRDIVGVLATRAWLAARGAVRVPADNRALVEAATHPDHLDELATAWGAPWPQHRAFACGTDLAEGGVARLSILKWDRPIAENPLPDDRKVMTRLGLNDRRIDLPAGVAGPFGGTVSGFNLPGWMAEDLAEDAVATDLFVSEGKTCFQLGEMRFCYDRLGLRQIND